MSGEVWPSFFKKNYDYGEEEQKNRLKPYENNRVNLNHP